MARLIEKPTIIRAAGDPPKRIEEFIGRVNTDTAEISVARMTSPSGWSEPGQTPAFSEYTLVLRGTLVIETRAATLSVGAGQAALVPGGAWVRYSTPGPEGAEYIAVCLPAFSPDTVHRDPA
jgi:mannose-6-phosphate isomerase-like protein (cupin superfamily)